MSDIVKVKRVRNSEKNSLPSTECTKLCVAGSGL